MAGRKGHGHAQDKLKLRDWVFSRQRYWGEPIPMVYCEKCGWVPLPESELPLVLPEIKDFEPTATAKPAGTPYRMGEHHLPVLRRPRQTGDGHHAPVGGLVLVLPALYGPAQRQALASREALEYWSPVDWYNGGMEHTTLHLLYSRFWHKFLYDIGVVPTREPYQKRTSHGMILGENGEKMSKSRGNVVNPTISCGTTAPTPCACMRCSSAILKRARRWTTASPSGLQPLFGARVELCGYCLWTATAIRRN